MNKKTIHYVYEHWRPDTGVIFYVGKGKGRRAWEMKWGRNRWHKSIVSKLIAEGLSVDIRIVHSQMSDEESIAKEIELIYYWRSLGVSLVNMTDGGEGKTGAKFSEESKEKMSRDRKGRPLSEAHRQNMIKGVTGLKKTPEHIAKVAASIAKINIGRRQNPEDVARRVAKTLKSNPNHYKDIAVKRAVICVNDGISYETLTQAAMAYGLKKGAVCDSCRKKIRHTSNGLVFRYADDPDARNASLATFSRAKKVFCVDDGRIFESTTSAARNYGLKKADSITAVCSGKKYRLRAAGRQFKYAEAA